MPNEVEIRQEVAASPWVEPEAVPLVSQGPKWWITEPLCPRCGEFHMSRQRLPIYLRPLRWLGIGVTAYKCRSCKARLVRWR